MNPMTFATPPEPQMENFQGGYNESRPKRIREIVERYGADNLAGKTMLEVGAGYGHIGAEFANKYGVNVLATDARPEYVEMIRKLFPQVRADVQDLEQPWPYENKFDLVLFMGVLHHIHPDHVPTVLADVCAAGDFIVLEHEVCDNEDPDMIVSVQRPHYDQSVHSVGCQPTTAYIERVLGELGMNYDRVMNPRLDGPAGFTWEPGHAPGGGPRRFWFVWK